MLRAETASGVVTKPGSLSEETLDVRDVWKPAGSRHGGASICRFCSTRQSMQRAAVHTLENIFYSRDGKEPPARFVVG